MRRSDVGVIFDEHDLFPLLPESALTYAEAQAHAARVDLHLGLRIEEIENELARLKRADGERSHDAAAVGTNTDAVQDWIGLASRTLLTPYTEIRLLLERLELRKDQGVIDLGAGYGRMGFVIGHHRPDIWFRGFELVAARVEEANRVLALHDFPRVRMDVQDLSVSSFELPEADVYFIYDFGSSHAIEKTLQDLRRLSMRQAFRVVGRGRASRDAIERNHPWLSQVHAPAHFSHYSIYRSRA